MRDIGIIVNRTKPRAAEALRRVVEQSCRLGLTLHAEAETCAWAPAASLIPVESVAHFKGRVEAVVALGGDGTLLHAAHDLDGSDLPLLGLNIGSLGFLTCVEEANFGEALRALREDRIQVSNRATLSARIVRGDGRTEKIPLHALNDVVLARGTSARLVYIGLDLDGTPVTTYACDGVIVATATGSTAYALAAGGPILMPETPALAISVICPHALSARPLVVPVDLPLTLRCETAAEPLMLALDGRECGQLEAGDRVEVARSSAIVRIAFLADLDPYAVLRLKLGWGGSLVGRLRQESSRTETP